METVQESPPPLLYHYTNGAGLVGILGDKVLWATDLRFLNDGEELRFATRTLSNFARSFALELEEWAADEQQPQEERWSAQGRSERLSGIADAIDAREAYRYEQFYAACFCSDGDLLSQWRAYAQRDGFALGFDSSVLAEDAAAVGGQLVRVLYGKDALQPVIDELRLIDRGAGFPGSGGESYTQQTLLPWLTRVKNPAFEEEHEWRVVIETPRDRTQGIAFRTSDGLGVVPYVKMGLSINALRRVVVGPGSHVEVRRAGIEQFVSSVTAALAPQQGVDARSVEVVMSSIAESYRFP
jgi:hypothetical protein